ncbi:Uncharacterized protein QTN25_000543 [Entamoeba marina]
MFTFFLITCLFALCYARPAMPKEKLGKVTYSNNQTKYSFSNKHSKGGDVDLLEYDVDFKDNFHSLDHEMTVEDVFCKETSLEVKTTTRDIEQWGDEFYVVGTVMWNCKKSFKNKVKRIRYRGMEESLYKYELEIEEIKMEELFKTASINYVPSNQNTEPKKVDIDKELIFKQKQQSSKQNIQPFKIKKQQEQLSEDSRVNIAESNQLNHNIIHFRTALKGASGITITSPEKDSIYFTDDIITFNCTFDSTWDGYDITNVIVYIRNSATNLGHYELFDHFKSIDVPFYAYLLVPDYDPSEYYYLRVEVEYSGGWSSTATEDSDYIKFNVEPPIVITSPEAGEIIDFTQISSLYVSWKCSSTFTYDDMQIWLMQDIPFSKDKTIVEGGVVDYSKGYHTFSLPSNIVSGSNYYIQITYDYTASLFYQSEYSERFTIYADSSYSLPVQLTSPTFSTDLEEGDYLSIEWTNTEEMNNEFLNIMVYQNVVGLDPKRYEVENVPISNGKYSVRIDDSFPQGSNYYVYLTYNCIDYYVFETCDSQESERFSIRSPNKYTGFSES